MIHFPSGLDMRKLLAEVKRFDFWKDGSGAMMAIEPCKLPTHEILGSCPVIRAALEELGLLIRLPVRYVMINNLPPNTTVPKHTDTLTGSEKLHRYHLPVVTNDKCHWWDEENGYYQMDEGFWHGPMPFHLNHFVENLGETERIHLVVDLG